MTKDENSMKPEDRLNYLFKACDKALGASLPSLLCSNEEYNDLSCKIQILISLTKVKIALSVIDCTSSEELRDCAVNFCRDECNALLSSAREWDDYNE